jgi:hypothetical protein
MQKFFFPTGLVAAVLTALCACSAAPSPDAIEPDPTSTTAPQTLVPSETSPRPDTMVRLTLRLTTEGLKEISRETGRNTANRRDPHKDSPTYFVVLGEHGEELLKRGFRLERNRRLEPRPEQGINDAAILPIEEPVFSIPVPLPAGAKMIRLFEMTPQSQATVLGEVSL